MKFLNAKRYTITQVARLLAVHPSTVWRWKLKGVRGVKLKTVVIGGTRYVLEMDLKAFLAALNGDDITSDDDQEGRAAMAAARLDALGVKGAS